jgi:hypothetical protein
LLIEKVLTIDGQPDSLSFLIITARASGGYFLLPRVYPAMKNASAKPAVVISSNTFISLTLLSMDSLSGSI